MKKGRHKRVYINIIPFIYNLKQAKRIYSDRKYISDCLGPGMRGCLHAKGKNETFGGYGNFLYIDCGNDYIGQNTSNYNSNYNSK